MINCAKNPIRTAPHMLFVVHTRIGLISISFFAQFVHTSHLQGEIQFGRSEEGDGGSHQGMPFQTLFSIQFIRIAAACQGQEKEEEKRGGTI